MRHRHMLFEGTRIMQSNINKLFRSKKAQEDEGGKEKEFPVEFLVIIILTVIILISVVLFVLKLKSVSLGKPP